MRFVLLTALLLVLILPAQAQRVIFVDDDAATGGDGASWQTAFRSLQDALAQSQGGDSVFVAEGRYTPDVGAGLTRGDRTLSFEVKPGVSLFGGFRGTETYTTERVFGDDYLAVYPSVLSGDLAENDEDSVYADAPFMEDNSRRLLRLTRSTDPSLPVIVDGFVVEGAAWGGIIVERAGFFSRMHIRRNTDRFDGGAGMEVQPNERIRISRSLFERNHNTSVGGGLSVSAPFGLGNQGVRVRVEDTRFARNYARSAGGGAYLVGWTEMLNVAFEYNASSYDGGALTIDQGNSDFLRNEGDTDDVYLVNVHFKRNTAPSWGGALSCYETKSVFGAQLLFSQNEVTQGDRTLSGGGWGSLGCQANVYLSTFVGNKVTRDAEALYVSTDEGYETSLMGIVIGNHTGGTMLVRARNAKIAARYSVFADTSSAIDDQIGNLFSGDGSVAEDGAVSQDSPAIDRVPVSMLPADWLDVDADGDTTEALPLDLLGNPRVVGDAADAGAIERQEVTSAAEATASPSKNLRVWPNPSAGHVHVNRVGTFAVADLLGRRVAHFEQATDALDLSALSPGVYFVVWGDQHVLLTLVR